MVKDKTRKMMATLEKEKRKRARNKKGHYIADDPTTPQNEAYVPKEPKTYEDHIREATSKASKRNRGFVMNALVKIKEILFGKY